MAYKSIPGYKKPYFVEVPSNPAKSLEIMANFWTFFVTNPLYCFNGIKGINSKTRIFLAYRPIPSNRKRYFANFGQVSSKSNATFGSYGQKC